jgi:PAS domain S-box-containing protein
MGGGNIWRGKEICAFRVEEAEYQGRFRQMAENIQEIFWMIDVATRQVIYLGPAYERICGRTCASLYKDPLSYRDVIHPDDRQRVLSHGEPRREDWLRGNEFRIVRPDGAVHWLSTRRFPIPDGNGGIDRWVVVAEDITERKAAEEKLRASEAAQWEFIDSLPMAAFRVDRKGVLEMVNRAMVRM